jgi:hypothetical protein
MTLGTQVNEALAAVDTSAVHPHIAAEIEPGAILYSSWGYDQTNIDYYVVTRTTAVSCWILPMTHIETPGYAYDSGFTTPLEIVTHSDWCSCDHRVTAHDAEYGCRFWGAGCECKAANPAPLKAQRHKISRYRPEGVISLSYSNAYLWDGKANYASHYA